MDISHIFRAYDIRGLVDKELNEEVMEKIGFSFSRFIKKDALVSNDMRDSSKKFKQSLIKGFIRSGNSITDIGTLPVGIAIFWAKTQKKPLAYITASHVSSKYNGVKFYGDHGLFDEEENEKIKELFFSLDMKVRGSGEVKTESPQMIMEEYKSYILSKIKISRPLKVIIDPMNAAASLAIGIFKEANLKVETVRSEMKPPEGDKELDPNNDALEEMKSKIKDYDIGIAFDGDADRMVIMDENGRTLQPEETSFLILSELLKKQDGPIIVNVECSKTIDYVAEKYNRKLIRVPVGYTFLARGITANNACFGVERSGHYGIPSIGTENDAISTALYALYALSLSDRKLSEIINELPRYSLRRIDIGCDDKKKFLILDSLKQEIKSKFEKVNTIDGIRIDFDDSWILIRPSNTSPVIRITISAKTDEEMKRLEQTFHPLVLEKINQ